jgi:LAS superfamily LD-carboxypeptidase LdcB
MGAMTVNWKRIGIISGSVIALAGLGLWAYETRSLSKRLAESERVFASSTDSYIELLEKKKDRIEKLEEENEELYDSLTEEERKRRKLERLTNTQEEKIDNLTKLTTLDPELLKKYSKVYFLSENYVPTKLADIDPAYIVDPSRKLQVHADVAKFLNWMLSAAKKDGIDIKVASAYRSFQTQKELKSGYRFTYGAGTANQFSAEQGYSEHQLGTTLDFTTSTLKGTEVEFEETPAFKWLMQNAYDYGFVLSYPQSNGYYTYEPWHWRFVGEALASDLNREKKYFYEFDQRRIDDYLISIFD